MDKKERKAKMIIPTIIMGLLALMVVLIAYPIFRYSAHRVNVTY